jgi:exosome complex component RRP40
MSSTTTILLPGEEVPASLLPQPTHKKKALTLGPGLRHIPPSTIKATIAGALATDAKKNAAWIDFNSGRYIPAVNDLVIATVHGSGGENFQCFITPNTPLATLPHLSFEGATRKTRPQLAPHSLVYARITNAGKEASPELACVDASTGKSEGLGPLKGGMVFPISMGMARRLLAGKKGGVIVFEGLGEKLGFEVVVGRNGVLWVDGGNVKTTLAVGRAVQEVDEKALDQAEQRKLVQRVLKKL